MFIDDYREHLGVEVILQSFANRAIHILSS